MRRIEVVSFDAEGTLVTPRFSKLIWEVEIPSLYARKSGLGFEQARQEVLRQYEEVGDRRLEWYDIGYWFRRFGLEGYSQLLEGHRDHIGYYPDVEAVLKALAPSHRLIVISNSAREFLDILVGGIAGYFSDIYSTISDFNQLKSPELYSNICQKIGVEPQHMVHVGDHREFDYAIPRRAGVCAVHLDRDGECLDDGAVRDLREFETQVLAFNGPT